MDEPQHKKDSDSISCKDLLIAAFLVLGLTLFAYILNAAAMPFPQTLIIG